MGLGCRENRTQKNPFPGWGWAAAVCSRLRSERLEQALSSHYQRAIALHEHFHLIGGTSTGSIIAAALALGVSRYLRSNSIISDSRPMFSAAHGTGSRLCTQYSVQKRCSASSQHCGRSHAFNARPQDRSGNCHKAH